jgi:hypothetical protein
LTPAIAVLALICLAGVIYTGGDGTIIGCTSRALFGFYLGVLMYRYRFDTWRLVVFDRCWSATIRSR